MGIMTKVEIPFGKVKVDEPFYLEQGSDQKWYSVTLWNAHGKPVPNAKRHSFIVSVHNNRPECKSYSYDDLVWVEHEIMTVSDFKDKPGAMLKADGKWWYVYKNSYGHTWFVTEDEEVLNKCQIMGNYSVDAYIMPEDIEKNAKTP